MPAQAEMVKADLNSASESDTLAIGERLGRLLAGGETIALSGSFGAGKTVFAQGIAVGLGIEDHLTSPSFALANSYHSDERHLWLHHLDLYRVSTPAEAMTFGIEEYFNPSAVTLIEWPAAVDGVLPDDTIQIEISLQNGDNRRIAVSFPSNFADLAKRFLGQIRREPADEHPKGDVINPRNKAQLPDTEVGSKSRDNTGD